MPRSGLAQVLVLAASVLLGGCSTGPDAEDLDLGGGDPEVLYEEALAGLPRYAPFHVEPGAFVVMHEGGAAVVRKGDGKGENASRSEEVVVEARTIDLPIPLVPPRDVWRYAGGWRMLTFVGLPRAGFIHDLFDLPFSGGQMKAMTGGRPRPRAVFVDDLSGRFYAAMRMADDGARELALEIAAHGEEPPCEGVIVAEFALRSGERTAVQCLEAISSGAWLYDLWAAPDGRTIMLKYRDGPVHERPRLAFFDFETGADLGTLFIEDDLVTDGVFLNGEFYYLRQLSGIVGRLTPADPTTGAPLRDEAVLEIGPYPPRSSIVRRLLLDEDAGVLRVVFTDGTDTHIYTLGASGVSAGVTVAGVVGRNAELDAEGNVVLREYDKTWSGQPGQPGYAPPSAEQLVERFFTVDPATGEVLDSLRVHLPVEAFRSSFFFVAP